MKKLKEKKIKDKKPKKIHKSNSVWYKIFAFILIIATVFSFGYVIYNETFKLKDLLPILFIVIAVVTVIVFVLVKTKLRCWIKNILSFIAFLIIVCEALLCIYGVSTIKFLNNITDTGYRVETYGIYVMSASKYNELGDIANEDLYYLTSTEKGFESTLKKLKKEVDIKEEIEKDNIEDLLNALITGDTNVIMFPDSYESILKEDQADKFDQIKKIYTVEDVQYIKVIKTEKNVDGPFNVYISGIDTTGNIAKSARSDVNIIMSINPNTGKVLLVSTPRDYYVKLNKNGKYDKLTHAGVYGIEESVKTLEDLYDIKIDYYVRVNFTSFIKIIDTLGGVQVNIPKSFCEQPENRDLSEEAQICLNKGVQTLDGRKALAYARDRHDFANGDFDRGKHQMEIIEAIIKKASASTVISKYNSLISSVEGRIKTNMDTEDIYKIARRQLKDNTSWSITREAAKGTPAFDYCYSGGGKASVVKADEKSIEYLKKLFKDNEQGRELTSETTTTTTKTVKAN